MKKALEPFWVILELKLLEELTVAHFWGSRTMWELHWRWKNEKNRNYKGYVSYQAHITKVKEAKWSGRDGFSLYKVLQDIRRRCLDVTIVLTNTQQDSRSDSVFLM